MDKSIAVYLVTFVVLIVIGCVCCWESEKAFAELPELPANWQNWRRKKYDVNPNHGHKVQN